MLAARRARTLVAAARAVHPRPPLVRAAAEGCRHVLPHAGADGCLRYAPLRQLSTASEAKDALKAPTQHAIKPHSDDANALTELRGSELVLSPPALVVTREYEWGNIILGFEQANRYTIRAAPHGNVVGYIAEESSMAGVVGRQVLRRRRPFRATVLDKHGDTIFILRRPMYLVSSSMYVEREDGSPIGEIQMRWHLYRRRYDLYVAKRQFASVDSGFLAMDFDMTGPDGAKIASVNKDFTGFARELFTDANQYILRLDPSMGVNAEGLVSDPTSVAPTVDVDDDSKLNTDERAVLLATAMMIDFDYFSHHSRAGVGPMGFMPVPIPGGGAAAGAGSGAAAEAIAGDMADDGLGPIDGEDDGLSSSPGSTWNDDGLESDEAQWNATSGGGDDGTQWDSPPPADNDGGQWAEFEEPDYGFSDQPPDEDWSGGGDEEGGSSVFGILKDIFGSDE